MIAVKRLQSLFWVLLVALGALSAYMVSLRVATERNALDKVRAQVAATRADIRYLETEISARSNMRQLEAWNAQEFKFTTPAAASYLDGERALAHLDGIQPNGPAYRAPPVMVAMVEGAGDLPAARIERIASADARQIRTEAAVTGAVAPAPKEASRPRPATPAPRLAHAGPAGLVARAEASGQDAGAGPYAGRAERMAMLDARLLDDGMLKELRRKLAAEDHGAR